MHNSSIGISEDPRTSDDVALVQFMRFAFTRMPGESYSRVFHVVIDE